MRTDNRFLRLIATVCLSVCLICLPAWAEEGIFTVHDAPQPAVEAAYVDKNGEKHALADLQGGVVVLHFWATWCPPCLGEMAELQEFLAAQDLNLTLLPLSADRSAETVKAFYAEHDLPFPVLLDERGAALRAFKGRGLPTTVVLDETGHEIARRGGVVNWHAPEVAAFLQSVAGKGEDAQPENPLEEPGYIDDQQNYILLD